MAYLDISKLRFTPEVERNGHIQVKLPSTGKMYPITKEQFLAAVEKGYHHERLHLVFTKQSIILAKGEPKPKKDKPANEIPN